MARHRHAMELPSIGKLDRSAGQLGRQLSRLLREAIQRGELKPGELLPSTRHLASALGVSRGIVLEAFEQLIAEGYLEAQAGAGTRVATALSDARERSVPAAHADEPAAPMRLSTRAEAFAAISKQFAPLPPVPFAVSVPVGPTAPDDVWRRLGNRTRGLRAAAPAGYDDPQGVPALRTAIADYVRRSRSVLCTPEQVIVTTGTQQGLYLSCQVLLDVNDEAWVEDPAYRGITGILESTGHQGRMVRVPVDDSGLDVEDGINMAPHARAAFVTPSHQYPLGMPLSMARRNALLAWARANGAWIVEDDYDSELRYVGHPFPSLQGLAPDRVVYLGTFSKILFPSLRLGYAIVPPPLVPAFCGARVLIDRHSPSAEQHVLAAFIEEGHLDRHIRRVRLVYADRRQHLIATIDRWIPTELAWLQPGDQGMHLVLWLAAGIDDEAVAALARQAGVSVRPVSPMYSSANARPGLVLGLGGYTNEQIEAAVKALAKVLASSARASRAARAS
ncbi:PLP-dependent aminotransferase family protein [Cupriavidus gilardii]|uniref:MocR-like pyridoxine biosynthesis transcription factor PdxR n=1 Tax=Cupriavidus gilardii TaxID=82541 RepID=UPI001ABE0755|nr:PLP-dependent aminotransferase family protein [Cupriavidus gilardii]MBO4123372.1 PLP-dependent aminotransferase family protein [Cupriavidus gilardii]